MTKYFQIWGSVLFTVMVYSLCFALYCPLNVSKLFGCDLTAHSQEKRKGNIALSWHNSKK